ncbi:N-acetylmuramoyl-L-alanine amidase [Deinococcus aerophilus]|uniref:N-acetylmuramoyl-L-alanine amidase n=1 Tax=Deinococcus aerophilus TaxID=522488 RepID=A0ABQ2GT40_9DEIO|nr:N-acetylmuramoyl-L-alanine amidase [Deinococcus aerophilus]GGM09743.1 N-acetylmuramoyl-L-alanine amidase [Deinococcus aerophilus]
MKQNVIFFSSALLLGALGSGQAQTGPQVSDPFQRGAPTQAAPVLRGPAGTPAASAPAAPLQLTGVQNATFGPPRSSSDGSTTRIVFDLMPGVSYTLTPTFTGLRLDVQGARVLPAVTGKLGSSVNEYRAGGGQATLITPFPLSLTGGWKAMEATLERGTRVLILDFGATLNGGASAALSGRVRASAPVTSAGAQTALSAPLNTAGVGTAARDTAARGSTESAASLNLPPGDAVAPSPGGALPPAPALPGADSEIPSALAGRVPGTSRGAPLTPPRIGRNPGQTRVVLDLPPGTSYRIVPGSIGLRVELSGVNMAAQDLQDISPELRAWRAEPGPDGVVFTLLTATPTTERSGWRAQLLPPSSGDLSRLAIDLSPALADLTPLSAQEKLLAAVPPIPAARGTAILALSASYVRPRVVIDPGHGGKDPGAVGAVIEKETVLDVAQRVATLLGAAGVDVVLTRDSDRDLNPVKDTDLTMRARMGTPGTQLFVSIHVNAMDAVSALRGYGVETWWNPNHPLSSNLAAVLQKNVVATTGAYSQGLKTGRSLAVLRNSRIPAALIEIGFTSHPVDGINLQDTNYRDRVALGIAQGIREALVTGIVDGGAVGGAGK